MLIEAESIPTSEKTVIEFNVEGKEFRIRVEKSGLCDIQIY